MRIMTMKHSIFAGLVSLMLGATAVAEEPAVPESNTPKAPASETPAEYVQEKKPSDADRTVAGIDRENLPETKTTSLNTYRVALNGYQGFSEYMEFKKSLRKSLPKGNQLFEHRLARGRVEFLLKTNLFLQDLRSHLNGFPLQGGALSVDSAEGDRLEVRIDRQ